MNNLLTTAIRELQPASPNTGIQARFLTAPSIEAFNENNTYFPTQQLDSAVPGGQDFIDMQKTQSFHVFSISGGDGGPYTVTFNLTPTYEGTSICGGTGNESGPMNQDSPSNVFNNVTAGGSLTNSNDPANGHAAYIVSSAFGTTGDLDPQNQTIAATLRFSGSVTIEDGSSNTLTLYVPDGSEGNWPDGAAGAGGEYTDSYSAGDSSCIPT